MAVDLQDRKAHIAAGVGLVSVARFLGGLLNLLTIICLIRLLEKAEFGQFIWIYMVQETINAIGSLGLPSALIFYIPKLGKAYARALGLWIGGLLFLIALPFAFAVCFGGPYLAELFGFVGFDRIMFFLAIALIADFPGQTLPGYLVARERWLGSAALTFFYYLTRFACIVVPAALGAGIEDIIGWYAGSAVLRALAFVVYFTFIEEGSLGPEVRAKLSLKDAFSYGLPLSFSVIVGKLNVQIDKYMIGLLATVEVLAVYGAGATELPLVAGIAYSITNTLVPTLVGLFHKGKIKEFIEYWHGSMIKVAAIMMPITVFFMVMAESGVRLLFSVAYEDAAIPFRVYLGLLPLRLCAYGAVVRATGLTRPILLSSVLGLIVNAGLNYPLYLTLGMAGPATASVLAQCTAIITLLTYTRARLNISWTEVFPFRPVIKTAFWAVVSAVPLVGIALYVEGDLLSLIAGGVTYLVCYLVIGRRTGVLSKSDIVYIRDLLSLRTMRRLSSKEKR